MKQLNRDFVANVNATFIGLGIMLLIVGVYLWLKN